MGAAPRRNVPIRPPCGQGWWYAQVAAAHLDLRPVLPPAVDAALAIRVAQEARCLRRIRLEVVGRGAREALLRRLQLIIGHLPRAGGARDAQAVRLFARGPLAGSARAATAAAARAAARAVEAREAAARAAAERAAAERARRWSARRRLG